MTDTELGLAAIAAPAFSIERCTVIGHRSRTDAMISVGEGGLRLYRLTLLHEGQERLIPTLERAVRTPLLRWASLPERICKRYLLLRMVWEIEAEAKAWQSTPEAGA